MLCWNFEEWWYSSQLTNLFKVDFPAKNINCQKDFLKKFLKQECQLLVISCQGMITAENKNFRK